MTPEFTSEQKQKIELLVDQTMKENGIPGAIVGIWVPGKGEFLLTKGLAEIKKGREMKLGDKVRIGSCTKSFTVTVLLQLVDKGMVSLDDTLDKYDVGSAIPNSKNITVRQCCDMTSGLFSYTADKKYQESINADPMRKRMPSELPGFAVSNDPYFPPGTGFEYSNTNTVIIGLIIEQMTGNKIEDGIKGRIIEQLGLDNTTFPATPEITGEHSHGYIFDEEQDKLLDATNIFDLSWAWAAGAMISNLYDLRIWAKALGTGVLISESSQKERLKFVEGTIEDLKIRYGLGIFAIDGFIGHGGELPGYSVAPFYNPDKDATIVVLLNKQPNKEHLPCIKLVQNISKIVVPEEPL